MSLIYASVLGILFGYALHRVGAANPDRIINMLRLRDFHLMKTILLAIAFSSFLLFTGLAVGLVEPDHLSVKGATRGVMIGGAILGVGWGIAGYCPGTGVAALGSGRRDALYFLLGGLVGAFLFMLAYPAVVALGWMQPILGGKVTLALAEGSDVQGILSPLPGFAVAAFLSILLFLLAWSLPSQRQDSTS